MKTSHIKNFFFWGSLMFLLVFSPKLSANKWDPSITLALSGGTITFLEHGSSSNYTLFMNHFPITPEYIVPSAGVELSFKVFRNFYVNLLGAYVFDQEITAVDPVDQDKIRYKTQKLLDTSLKLNYYLFSGFFKPYLAIGAGFFHKSQIYKKDTVTEYNYPITLRTRPSESVFVAGAGLGIKIFLIKVLALKFEGLYMVETKSSQKMYKIGGCFEFNF